MAKKTETLAISEVNENYHPCECQKWSIETWTGEVPDGANPQDYVVYTETHCIQDTTRTFAPGHDAKLKSLMIQAGAQGDAMRVDEDGMASIGDPTLMAARFGFEHQVGAGIKKALVRKAERAAKKLAKAEAKANKPAKTAKKSRKVAPLVAPVTIKVGRWTYEGAIINPADNSAEYTSGKGDKATTKTAAEGKYQIVTK